MSSQIVPFTRHNVPKKGDEIEYLHENELKKSAVTRYEIDEEEVSIFVKDPKTGKELEIGKMLYINVTPKDESSSSSSSSSSEEDEEGGTSSSEASDEEEKKKKRKEEVAPSSNPTEVRYPDMDVDGKRTKHRMTDRQQAIIQHDVEKYRRGKLHSGSKHGPKVKSLAQALAIGYHAARK